MMPLILPPMIQKMMPPILPPVPPPLLQTLHIYDVDVVAVLTIGACVFFTYNKRSSQTSNKEQVQEQPIKPTMRRSMF